MYDDDDDYDNDEDRTQQRTDTISYGEVNHLNTYPATEGSDQSSSGGTSLGQLRHTRDKLRLEIPTISLSDASKSTTASLENGENGLEKFNGQNLTTLNLKRTEPEVSEV